jgi:hypothetical protein
MTFTGELMTCIVCSKQQPSDPDVESNWRAFALDGVTFYTCPDEFPPDDAPAEQFKAAYTTVLHYCLAALHIRTESFTEDTNDPA